MTIQGRYEKTNVSIHGALFLEWEGEAVRFRWQTARGGCDLPLRFRKISASPDRIPGEKISR